MVGDGCTDDSEAVVKGIEDERLRWIGLTENCGHQSEPNNVGLREARGEFIAYLGHDDIWLPHHLQACLERLDQAYDLAFGLALMVSQKKDTSDLRPATGRYKPGLWIPPSAMVHRRRVTDSIGGWTHYKELKRNPETDLWHRAHAAGFKIAFVPRLSVVKIPAASRKNVYKTRSEHEQAHWFERIQLEPGFEQEELALSYMRLFNLDLGKRASMPYRKLLSYFWFRTLDGFSSRFRGEIKKGAFDIDTMRKYKGLKPKP